MDTESGKVKEIKEAVGNGSYDLEKAVEGTADKILKYPQSLLWR